MQRYSSMIAAVQARTFQNHSIQTWDGTKNALWRHRFSPNLTWRDMQHLVLRTANTDPFLDAQWVTNGVGRKGSAGLPLLYEYTCTCTFFSSMHWSLIICRLIELHVHRMSIPDIDYRWTVHVTMLCVQWVTATATGWWTRGAWCRRPAGGRPYPSSASACRQTRKWNSKLEFY